MRKILSFVRKELIQLGRDRRMLGVVLVSPIIQLILLGYAANMDVKVVETTVIDFDKSYLSRKFIQILTSNKYFKINYYSENYDVMQTSIESGESILGIVIPRNFERDLIVGNNPKIQAIFDASNGNKTSIVFGYLANVFTRFNELIVYDFQKSNLNAFPTKELLIPEIRVWYNPEMVTRKFLLPGIVALLLLIIAVPLTAMAVVKERELGTIEQIMISPLKSYEIIFGKLIPFLIIGFLDFTFVFLVMRFWFGIEVKGSIILLYLTAFLFILSNLGLGLFISTISKSLQQAMIVSVFAVIVPMIYLSGFVFPIENMPKIIQPITNIFPLKYFLIILRGIVLKGIGLNYLWKEALILLFFGILFFIFSSVKFRKILT